MSKFLITVAAISAAAFTGLTISETIMGSTEKYHENDRPGVKSAKLFFVLLGTLIGGLTHDYPQGLAAALLPMITSCWWISGRRLPRISFE